MRRERRGARRPASGGTDRELCEALWALNRAIGFILVPLLKRASLTKGQFLLLHFIARQEGATVSIFASRLGVSPPTVTQIVNELERDGCVERRRSESDRRVVVLTATAKGRGRLGKIEARVARELGAATRSIATDRKSEAARVLLDAARSLETSTRPRRGR